MQVLHCGFLTDCYIHIHVSSKSLLQRKVINSLKSLSDEIRISRVKVVDSEWKVWLVWSPCVDRANFPFCSPFVFPSICPFGPVWSMETWASLWWYVPPRYSGKRLFAVCVLCGVLGCGDAGDSNWPATGCKLWFSPVCWEACSCGPSMMKMQCLGLKVTGSVYVIVKPFYRKLYCL